jgi:hypothetical protein
MTIPTLDIRDNLLKYAEESAYSSKGHFKTADYTRKCGMKKEKQMNTHFDF